MFRSAAKVYPIVVLLIGTLALVPLLLDRRGGGAPLAPGEPAVGATSRLPASSSPSDVDRSPGPIDVPANSPGPDASFEEIVAFFADGPSPDPVPAPERIELDERLAHLAPAAARSLLDSIVGDAGSREQHRSALQRISLDPTVSLPLRRQAMTGLALQGRLEELIALLRTSGPAAPRLSALRILHRHAADRSLDAFESLARNDGDPTVRLSALLARVNASPETSVPLLLELGDDASPAIQARAVELLGRTGSRKALTYLDAIIPEAGDIEGVVRLARSVANLASVDSSLALSCLDRLADRPDLAPPSRALLATLSQRARTRIGS